MRNFAVITIFAMLSQITFIDCNSHTPTKPTQSHATSITTLTFQQKYNTQKDIYSAIANPNNPYDYIGILHNMGLDYHISNLPSNPNNSTIFTKTADFVSIIEGSNPANGSLHPDSIANITGIVGNVIEDNIHSLRTKVAEVLDDVSSVAFMNDFYTQFDTVSGGESRIQLIMEFENKLASSSINPRNRQLLFTYLSVAKHSAAYWEIGLSGKNSPVDENKIASVLDADAIGALLGLGIGSLIGLATVLSSGGSGLPAAIGIALGGALVGGVVGSVMYCLGEIQAEYPKTPVGTTTLKVSLDNLVLK